VEKVYKTFEVEKKTIDADAGIYEAWISTEAVDRDNDIIKAEGAILDNYRKNPVVLFGHNYRDVEAVVGKTLEVEAVPEKGVRARFQFTPKGDNPKADIAHRLWAGGFLNATSVGFNPLEYEKRKDEDGEFLDYGYLFNSWELLEFSIVPVPANQDALRLAIKEVENEIFDMDNPYLRNEQKEIFEAYNESEPKELDIEQETEIEVDPIISIDEKLTDDEIDAFADDVNEILFEIVEVLNEHTTRNP